MATKKTETQLNIELSNYIDSLTKKELAVILWNFTLLRADEDFVEAKKLLQAERKLIRRNGQL